MILKVDHVSFSCPLDYQYAKVLPPGFHVDFIEEDLENIPCKLPFLHRKQDAHTIIFLKYENSVPIEITQYKQCSNVGTNIELRDGRYCLYVNDINASQLFFENFGFKTTSADDQEITMEINPLFDRFIFKIKLVPAQNNNTWFLDQTGYSSIAFFVDDIQKTMGKMKSNGYETASPFELKVNGKMFNIGFMRGKNGEIIEIIELKREQRK